MSEIFVKLSNCNRYDVATYEAKALHLSDAEQKDLIKKRFVPDETIFAKTERCFQFDWLSMVMLIPLVKMLLTVYFVCCSTISFQEKQKSGKVKNLYSQPFRHWPTAVSIFKMFQIRKKKEKSNKPVPSLHNQTWSIFDDVLSKMKRLVEEVDLRIDRTCKKEVEGNRKRLEPMTVILLGRLGLAFRWHRDDSQFHPNVGEYSNGGVGNFVEVLNYRVRVVIQWLRII